MPVHTCRCIYSRINFDDIKRSKKPNTITLSKAKQFQYNNNSEYSSITTQHNDSE